MHNISMFSERLRLLIGSESLTSFASRAKVSEGTLRNLLKGGDPKLSSALRIAQAGEKSLGWLVDEDQASQLGEESTTYSLSTDEFVQIPYYKVDISAGHGGNVVDREQYDPMVFRRDSRIFTGLNPDNLKCAHVPGDSMVPDIEQGSDVLFDTTIKHIENGLFYVFNAGGDLLIKKMIVGFNHYIAKSSNKNGDYEDRVIEKHELESLNIIGRAEVTLNYKRLYKRL